MSTAWIPMPACDYETSERADPPALDGGDCRPAGTGNQQARGSRPRARPGGGCSSTGDGRGRDGAYHSRGLSPRRGRAALDRTAHRGLLSCLHSAHGRAQTRCATRHLQSPRLPPLARVAGGQRRTADRLGEQKDPESCPLPRPFDWAGNHPGYEGTNSTCARRSSAAAENARILATRSVSPVSSVSARSTGPVTARQQCPGASP